MIVDYYSRYMEIARLKQTTTEEVMQHTKSIFARHGIPTMDPSTAQDSTESLPTTLGFIMLHQVLTTRRGRKSNLLKKEKDPYLALLAYRTTPLKNGYSPAELLMNRKLRTTVPITREMRQPVVPNVE